MGATAVALMRQDSSLSAVDAILRSHPALQRKLSPAAVSSLRADEACSVQDRPHMVHRLVRRAKNIVYQDYCPQRRPSAKIPAGVAVATALILQCMPEMRVRRLSALFLVAFGVALHIF